jgi:hypothetical protein
MLNVKDIECLTDKKFSDAKPSCVMVLNLPAHKSCNMKSFLL